MTRKTWKDVAQPPRAATNRSSSAQKSPPPDLEKIAENMPKISALLEKHETLKKQMQTMLQQTNAPVQNDPRYSVQTLRERQSEISHWENKRKHVNSQVKARNFAKSNWEQYRDISRKKSVQQLLNARKAETARDRKVDLKNAKSTRAEDWSRKRDRSLEMLKHTRKTLEEAVPTAESWSAQRDRLNNNRKPLKALNKVIKAGKKAKSFSDKIDERRAKLKSIFGGEIPQELESLDEKLEKIKSNMSAKRALERSNNLRKKINKSRKDLKDWEKKRDKAKDIGSKFDVVDKLSKKLDIGRNMDDLDERRKKAVEKQKQKKRENERLEKRSRGRSRKKGGR